LAKVERSCASYSWTGDCTCFNPVRMRIAVILACVAIAAAPGCARKIPLPRFVPQPTSALVEVEAPAPPARVEIVPDVPSRSAVWVDGEWSWRHGRWAWLRGRWVAAQPHASFSPWVFVRGPDGRMWYAPGVWRDEQGTPVDPPAVLAYASAESGPITAADGSTPATGPTVLDRQERSTTVP
jgi:hypothetical protein